MKIEKIENCGKKRFKHKESITMTTFYPLFRGRFYLFCQAEPEKEEDDDEDYVNLQTGADDVASSSDEDNWRSALPRRQSPARPKRQKTVSSQDERSALGWSSQAKSPVQSSTKNLTTRTASSGSSQSGTSQAGSPVTVSTANKSPTMMLIEIERQKLQLMKEQLEIDKKKLDVEKQNGALLREILNALKKPSDGTFSTSSEKRTPALNLSKVRNVFENMKH